MREEVGSGANDERPVLKALLNDLRDGDTLVVWKLDRLARSVSKVLEVVQELNNRNVRLHIIDLAVDTGTPTGRFFLTIVAGFAELERHLIQERVVAGLEEAKRKGVKLGRRRVMTPYKVGQARDLLARGVSARKTARAMGVSKSTLYRYLPGGSTG